MKYKMLVLDMDDTLLKDDYTVSDINKKKLIEAQELGVYVVLASGRPTPAMVKFAKDLQLDKYESYMLSYNGAIITALKNNEVIFEQSLNQEQIHQLYDYSKEKNTHIITYMEGEIVSETTSEYIDVEVSLTGMEHNKVASFKESITTSAVKCILLEEPNYLKTIAVDLKNRKPDLSISISKPFFLEVMPNGIDKAASLRRLADRLDILQSEIIAVGNAGNDLSMVEYAGLGVWVDNVTPELRDRADVIVASNNDDGVAEVVDRFILN